MALELLKYSNAVRQANAAKLITDSCAWVDGIGLVGIWVDGPNYNQAFYGAAQLDGEVVRVTERVSLLANYAHDYGDGGLLATVYGGPAGHMYTTDAETNIWVSLYDAPALPTIYPTNVRLPDRWLRVFSGTVYTAPLDGSSDWTVEHTFTADNQETSGSFKFFSGNADVSSAGGGLYWLCYHYGGIALYDADNLQVVESHKVAFDFQSPGRLQSMHWSRELGVFVAAVLNTSSDRTDVYVFSDETRPFSLSDPVALSTPTRGQVTSLEVEVLGEHGDLVVGIPVDWSLTAGTGQLTVPQSITGADGKAQVGHIPDNLPSSGFTLQAEVQY